MNRISTFFILSAALGLLLITGCQKRSSTVWDDHKTTGRYLNKDAKLLWGTEGEPLVKDEEDFVGPAEEDFIPLRDEDLQAQLIDGAIPQPKTTPGEPGSGLPGVENFITPAGELAALFKAVYFNTDDHILRGKDTLSSVEKMANYLKNHPSVYIFISGHCDERGPEAYNLALGARRANYVRTLLVKQGVDPEKIHTISYGKERPMIFGHNPESWAKNRRAEFKIFEQ